MQRLNRALLDGAMGTMVQKLAGSEAGLSDLLNIHNPQLIAKIHEGYLEAGADIIKTNTFSANRFTLEEYNFGNRAAEINIRGAEIAKEVAKRFSAQASSKPRYVAGVLGPGSRAAGFSTDVDNPGARGVTFQELSKAYFEQAVALQKGGVDLFLIETVYDAVNAKAALYALLKLREESAISLPVMVSATVNSGTGNGRLLCGQDIEAFLITISHFPLWSVGLNCSFGAESMKPYLRELRINAKRILGKEVLVSAHPNAGLPDLMGEYSQTPQKMASHIRELLQEGVVDIIGGCCGTTPQHIAEMAKVMLESNLETTREINGEEDSVKPLMLSGLEPLVVGDFFVNIGERTNVAGSKLFLRLIKEREYAAAVEIACKQAEGGAMVIDVNMDDGMLDAVVEIREFLKLLVSEPQVAKLPIMIDSSSWEVQKAALEVLPGKSVVNSISLQEGEEKFLWQAKEIAKYGAAVVVMAFDEMGQADSFERRIEICERAYKLLIERASYRPVDIIFDTNIFPVGTGMEEHRDNAINFFKAAAWISKNLPGVGISGGVSNVSFAFRGNNRVREAMHSAFLYYGIRHGMTMAIVNPQMLMVYEKIESSLLKGVEDVLLNSDSEATERLLKIAQEIDSDKGGPISAKESSHDAHWHKGSVGERLAGALVMGSEEFLSQDIGEALQEGFLPQEIIESLLMEGMKEVGELFGCGKIFLPQVIKSARVMKSAVALITPHLNAAERVQPSVKRSTPLVLLATVKGDVHDIGKNIVGAVLSCNGCNIDDMGVMVDAEDIANRAESLKPDVIGLSGLITPSLNEMVKVVKALERRGLSTPVMIGGATTSKIYTAVRIAPEYSGPVVYVPDASVSTQVVSKLTDESKSYLRELSLDYTLLREGFYGRRKSISLLSLKEARENRLQLDWSGVRLPKRVDITQLSFEVEQLFDFIDWREYVKLWGVEPNDETELLLKNSNFIVKGVYAIFDAVSCLDDSIMVYSNSTKERYCTLQMLRQQIKKPKGEPNLCLADYVTHKESGSMGAIGAFCVTVDYDKESAEPLILESLAHRLAEAASRKLHSMVAPEGIAPAPGYPSAPDHLEKKKIWKLLNVEELLGAYLTQYMVMVPIATVCGYYFFHPDSRYFGVGIIDKEQLEEYAHRINMPVTETNKWLSQNIL